MIALVAVMVVALVLIGCAFSYVIDRIKHVDRDYTLLAGRVSNYQWLPSDVLTESYFEAKYFPAIREALTRLGLRWVDAKVVGAHVEPLARPTLPPTDHAETPDERVLRKARDIRTALLQHGVVVSPDAYSSLDELPPERRDRWIKLARTYVEIFCQ